MTSCFSLCKFRQFSLEEEAEAQHCFILWALYNLFEGKFFIFISCTSLTVEHHRPDSVVSYPEIQPMLSFYFIM